MIASVAVPVSLIGAFGVMYLLGYSLDNLSLMALTISTGFVVDDVIVVLENVTRHIEAGTPRIRAALQGAREVAFTVLSMSLSLVAVFVPILLMGGIGGRLFREFAVTFSVTIAISSVISLTTTPMMCAYLLPQRREHGHSRLYRAGERAFAMMLDLYDRSLQRALQWPGLVILGLLATLYRCEAFLPEDRLDAVLDQRGGNCRQPIDCAIGWGSRYPTDGLTGYSVRNATTPRRRATKRVRLFPDARGLQMDSVPTGSIQSLL